jgi:hypothetical protein
LVPMMAVGMMAVGMMAVGMMAVGMMAVGMMAVGMMAVGMMAVGADDGGTARQHAHRDEAPTPEEDDGGLRRHTGWQGAAGAMPMRILLIASSPAHHGASTCGCSQDGIAQLEKSACARCTAAADRFPSQGWRTRSAAGGSAHGGLRARRCGEVRSRGQYAHGGAQRESSGGSPVEFARRWCLCLFRHGGWSRRRGRAIQGTGFASTAHPANPRLHCRFPRGCGSSPAGFRVACHWKPAMPQTSRPLALLLLLQLLFACRRLPHSGAPLSFGLPAVYME